MTFRLPHLLAALALHAAVLALVAGGLQCSPRVERPPVITGVLLDPSRQDVAERRRREAARQKEAEAQRRAQAEAEARKKKEAEALRQKQLVERQAAEKKAAAQRAAEKKKAEEAARLARERERAEAEAARRQAELDSALEREAAAREAARREAVVNEALAAWIAVVERHVRSNWRPPALAPSDLVCLVRITQQPDGTVTQVKVEKGSGNPQVDLAVQDAVLRASPLPTISDKSLHLREFLFEFVTP